MKKTRAVEAVVFGVVQGVGFRPFIYRTAKRFHYKGWVKNVGFGVEIHLESPTATDFSDFFKALAEEKPSLSLIEDIQIHPAEFRSCHDFRIEKTREGQSFVFISPDISLCENCRRELHTPTDRRYLYPFINCTDCGPRYTIVKALPYDRIKTTMHEFEMCADCRQEYSDPLERRYHAQPIACPVCGPDISLREASTQRPIPGGIARAADLLREGRILAIKGLGGFHLVCDALNPSAVRKLRAIKTRKTKPLALMARDLDVIKQYAHVTPEESTQIKSARRPIVLLRQKYALPGIAPGLKEMGFMLPYTPLHDLLLDEIELVVATSSNRKDSPIIKEEGEAEGIQKLCEIILSHDRPIHMRADDSVMKVAEDGPLFLRRARGFVPYPQGVPDELKTEAHILALGGELKDTISVYKNGYVVTSQFLGDLDEYQNYQYFQETLDHMLGMFEVKPGLVVTDLHPDFHTTRYAQRMKIPHLQVQHHFAHVLAPLLEHKIPPTTKVLGIAWDGFGYGADGTAWGAESLIADYGSYQRFAHFETIPLPGGDLAAKQPWRMALAYALEVYGENLPDVESLREIDSLKIQGIREMIAQGLNSPRVSSCGRLFDAVSYLVGLAPQQVEFEAEAPMLLEAAADEAVELSYPFSLNPQTIPMTISFTDTLRALSADLKHAVPVSTISATYHNTLAEVIAALAVKARMLHGIDTVVLAGGVFLNRFLLQRAVRHLRSRDFRVLRPLQYSPNDESISLGQIAYGLHHLKVTSTSD